MYNAQYVSTRGDVYDFGVKGSTVFDIDIGSGLSVDLNVSQGFSQIGESVQSQNIVGKNLSVKGAIYQNVPQNKDKLRNVFYPFSSGRLTFDNGYYIDVYVKETPSFSPKKDDGRFTMLLFAPFPFFSKSDTGKIEFGEVVPQFSFPVNFSEPHIFGKKTTSSIKNVINGGNVNVPFNVIFTTTGFVENISIKNTTTKESLKINISLGIGDTLKVFRSSESLLTATLDNGKYTEDVTSFIDETSDLYRLYVGKNRLEITDEFSKGKMLIADFQFNEAVTSIYEH